MRTTTTTREYNADGLVVKETVVESGSVVSCPCQSVIGGGDNRRPSVTAPYVPPGTVTAPPFTPPFMVTC